MYANRSEEIFANYLALIDQHLDDLVHDRIDTMYELRDFAERLYIHPTHLSNVIKQLTGNHPCYYYEEKLVAVAKNLLSNPTNSIADVALKLTYDPSNFTKWFKSYAGMSPSVYRKQLAQSTLDKVLQPVQV
ncbi:AraC family transcriptional regulator [Chitinophaga pendula]|uniref:helix-turn-helix domain-containing protein n=1 Tax=Chitinophaga TaxID=79328 RepID=UPI000BAEC45E|nr:MULTISPECIES: AraC family transcriptional regulator [Chitinophaga]ASZ14120.1 AraC family transcriptional regulator [Chitinophaga sp. MD30]UCJ08244.1 AraC family transcriptional regulator [Chitinophaga pendula]